MSQKNAPKMKDIATSAGCSVMTVSLALRGSHKVSEQRREQIRQLAADMGYRPNPLVSALVASRQRETISDVNVLAVLTKFEVPARQSPKFDEFYQQLWKGLEKRAEELGFRLEEFPIFSPKERSGEELSRVLRTRGIRGIVLFPGGDLHKDYPALDWSHFCAVAIAYHSPKLPVHRVASDHSHGMELALNQIEIRGYQRPGLAMTSTLDASIRYAISGRFLAWQSQIPKRRRIPFIRSDEIINRDSFLEWFFKHKPDAVLSLDPHVGYWMNECKDSHTSVFIHLAKKEGSPFCGISLHTFDVGQATVDTLARELYLNRVGLPEKPEIIMVSAGWEDSP